jgi:hypothetical protein
MTIPSDPGVQVAPGDPGGISSAAVQHETMADGLDSHASRIEAGVVSLAPVWEGQAAGAYRELSSLSASAFRAASGASRSAAATLRAYGRELERCQQEGKQALQQAEYYLGQAQDWQRKLTAAETAVRTAQGDLTRARGEISCSAPGPAGAGARSLAQAALTVAEHALTKAQSDERTAHKELEHALGLLRHWQQVGHQAFQDADRAAERGADGLDAACLAMPQIFQTPGVVPLAKSKNGNTIVDLVFDGSSAPFILAGSAGVIASAIGGAHDGIAGLASWAGRTLRTGATHEIRSEASPILREAGGISKDLDGLADAAGWAGAGLSFAAAVGSGESVPNAALHAGLSTAGAVLGGSAVGGVCEAGTLGLGTPGCLVLGGGAAAVGSVVGNGLADLIDDL